MLLLDSVCMREDMPLMIDTWFKSEPSVILLDDTCIAAASISTDTSKDLFRRIHSVLCTARFRTLQPHENTQEDRRFYKTEVDSSNSKFRYQHFFNPHGKSKHIKTYFSLQMSCNCNPGRTCCWCRVYGLPCSCVTIKICNYKSNTYTLRSLGTLS